jgi:hypothetical protein
MIPLLAQAIVNPLIDGTATNQPTNQPTNQSINQSKPHMLDLQFFASFSSFFFLFPPRKKSFVLQ